MRAKIPTFFQTLRSNSLYGRIRSEFQYGAAISFKPFDDAIKAPIYKGLRDLCFMLRPGDAPSGEIVLGQKGGLGYNGAMGWMVGVMCHTDVFRSGPEAGI